MSSRVQDLLIGLCWKTGRFGHRRVVNWHYVNLASGGINEYFVIHSTLLLGGRFNWRFYLLWPRVTDTAWGFVDWVLVWSEFLGLFGWVYVVGLIIFCWLGNRLLRISMPRVKYFNSTHVSEQRTRAACVKHVLCSNCNIRTRPGWLCGCLLYTSPSPRD